MSILLGIQGILNFPSISVTMPVVVPFICTVALMTGSFVFASNTMPVIFLFCCMDGREKLDRVFFVALASVPDRKQHIAMDNKTLFIHTFISY